MHLKGSALVLLMCRCDKQQGQLCGELPHEPTLKFYYEIPGRFSKKIFRPLYMRDARQEAKK